MADKRNKRGRMPDEMTLSELRDVWGLGRTQTWHLVAVQKVIPSRSDRYQIYVKKADVANYTPPGRRRLAAGE